MSNQVTIRFVKGIDRLIKENKVRSYRQFALSLNYLPQGLNEILKGKRNVTVDLIQRASELYKFNVNYFFLGKGSLYQKTYNQNNTILTVVTNNKNQELITHVPISAYAGYAENISNTVFFENLQTFSLPGFGYQSGTYRCFDVEGDSMEPTIYNREQIICSYIDSELWLNNIRTNMVYVIVTKDSILVKRVKRKENDSKYLCLLSDNDFYDPIKMRFNDIKEIWSVKMKLSPFDSSPKHIRNGLHHDVDHMKIKVTEQSSLIKNLNKTIEKLVLQNTEKTTQFK